MSEKITKLFQTNLKLHPEAKEALEVLFARLRTRAILRSVEARGGLLTREWLVNAMIAKFSTMRVEDVEKVLGPAMRQCEEWHRARIARGGQEAPPADDDALLLDSRPVKPAKAVSETDIGVPAPPARARKKRSGPAKK